MDVLYFLKRRTGFIRYFYDTGGEPFLETIRKIEAGESPFGEPHDSEDGEPATRVPKAESTFCGYPVSGPVSESPPRERRAFNLYGLLPGAKHYGEFPLLRKALPRLAAPQLHPVVPPHVLHFRHVPLRTKVKFPHSPQASPS